MHPDPTTRRVVFFGDSRADWWHVPGNDACLVCKTITEPGRFEVRT